MIIKLKFKEFKILSDNKERIMFWKENTEGFVFLLEQMGLILETAITFDEINEKYKKSIEENNIEKCIELFKKEFILSREHTYEFIENNMNNNEQIASIVNPIDQFDEETLRIDEDKIVGSTNEGEKTFAEIRSEE